MRLWKAVTLTSGTKTYWMLGAMVCTIITARFLGPEGRGVIAAATSWVALFVAIGHLSLSNVIVYLLGGQERERLMGIVAGSSMAVVAVTTLLGWIVAAAMLVITRGRAFHNISPPVLALAFAGLPFLLWMENGNSLLIILGDLKRLNAAQFLGTTAGMILVAVGVGALRGGVPAALAATLVSYAILIGYGLLRIVPASRPLEISRRIIRELLGGGVKLHMAAVSTLLFTHAAVVMLNQFRPVAEAGFFQLALQLMLAMAVVPMAIAVVAYSLVTRDGADGAWREHRTLVLQTMLYSVAAAAGAYLLAPLAIRLIAGRAFLPAAPVFRVMCFSIFGMALTTVMTPQWVARGYFLRATALALTAAGISVIGNYLLIPRYGMMAAAWMMVVAYMIHVIGNGAFILWIERRARLEPALEPLRG